jgi:hypothetical protein
MAHFGTARKAIGPNRNRSLTSTGKIPQNFPKDSTIHFSFVLVSGKTMGNAAVRARVYDDNQTRRAPPFRLWHLWTVRRSYDNGLGRIRYPCYL